MRASACAGALAVAVAIACGGDWSGAGPQPLAQLGNPSVTVRADGVVISAVNCPTLPPGIQGTLNGRPLVVKEWGAKVWGSSPDGLTPMRVCRWPLMVSGAVPTGTIELVLTDGTTTWEIRFADAGAPRTASIGPLRVGQRARLDTTPASATWVPAGTRRHSAWVDLTPDPWIDGQCMINLVDPSLGTSQGWDGYAWHAHVAAGPGGWDFVVPAVPAACHGNYKLHYDGPVELAVLACPAGVTCSAWEEATVNLMTTVGP